MKGLLLKDFYLLKGYGRTFFVVVLLFYALSLTNTQSLYFLFYPCMIAGMMPMTLYAYDEREKWSVYCGTLPYTKAQLVSAKYIIGLLVSMAMLLLATLIHTLKMIYEFTFVANEIISLVSCIAAISLLSPAVLMPFMFRFGVEKGRIVYYAIIGIGLAAFMLLRDQNLPASIVSNVGFLFIGSLFLLAVAIISYILSWLLSIAIYKKREV